MIYYSLVVRTHDGLSLAGCTDKPTAIEDFQDIKEAMKELKLLSRKLEKFEDRGSYVFSRFAIHFITALDLSFLVLCDAVYPSVLAFSFLNDIQREFLRSYEYSARTRVSRPFAFIDFDSFLLKTRARYNTPRSLTTRLDISTLSQELHLRPPQQLQADDLHMTIIALAEPSASFRTAANFTRHFMPLGTLGWTCVALNAFCAMLNLMRGVAVIQDGHVEAYNNEVFQSGAAFVLCCLLYFYQVYLMCVPTGLRRPLACATLGSICVCQLYLWEFRTQTLIFFHVTVGCASTFVIFTRQIQEKLPQYNL